MNFQQSLQSEIARSGPMPLARFMESAIRHYYATRPEPFGANGDFTTAPEISQMFGEVIGAWAAQVWIGLGRPPRISLIELGPGRGTLMADMLRATARVEGFHAALHIVLVEASPALRTRQAEALGGRSPQWRENLPLSENNPALVIGNEFLDALPVHQIIYRDGEWRERGVSVDESGVFSFTDLAVPPALLEHIPAGLPVPKEGDILELAPARNEYVRQTLRLIKPNGGAALFLDYGYDRAAYGDSMQALKRHQFTSPLSEPGGADLTAHVDFSALGKVAEEEGALISGPITQGLFLLNLGMAERAEALIAANPDRREEIEKALHRLTHSDEMGRIFKTIGFSYGINGGPPGF